MTLSIQQAEYLNDFKIKLIFSDGKKNIVDFEPFLISATNPMTKKYTDKIYFKNFRLTHGDLEWNDYEMCFPIWDLYTLNKIE